MLDVKILPAAEQDLIEIWIYTHQRWGETQANKYLDEIDFGIKTLSEIPYVGIDFSHVRSGYRRYKINHHNVFYRVENDNIFIIRVLHEEMIDDLHLR